MDKFTVGGITRKKTGWSISKGSKSDEKIVLSDKEQLNKSNKLMNIVFKMATSKVGKIILGHIGNALNSVLNNSREHLPYVLKEESKNLLANLQEDNTKVYTITFHIGFPSTSSIITAGKQNGMANLELSNSQSDAIEIGPRSFLKKSFGFNQKRIDFLSTKFFGVVDDYNKIYNILDWKQEDFGREIPYGLVKEEQSSLRIRNSNTYHALNVKIHLIKILDDDVDMHSLYLKTFNRFFNQQSAGSIPSVYQISDRETESNDYMNTIVCYRGANLTMSSNFKTQARIAKTFFKTLNPGDTLHFKMFHHCGPGVRFDVVKSYLLSAATGKGKQPSCYGIAVEVTGTPAEGVRLIDNAVFQGTSPGFYNYEYRKVIVVVKHSSLVGNTKDLTSTKKEYAIKIHESDYLTTRPFTIGVDKIGDPGEKNKEFSVVSVSSLRPVYSQDIADVGKDDDKSKLLEELKEIDSDLNEEGEEGEEDE